MTRVFRISTVVGCVLLGSGDAARAQSIKQQLSSLFTAELAETRPVSNAPAAAITRDSLAGLFAIEMTTLPMAPSAGGFSYRFEPSLGVYERATSEFGPFFTERTLQNARGQASLGFSYQFASFATLQGASLRDGSFMTTALRHAGSDEPFSTDSLYLHLETITAAPSISYGVTRSLAVSVSVPFVNVWFSGERLRTEGPFSSLQSVQSGSKTGLGDVAVRTRYFVAGRSAKGVAVGADVRLPTAKQEDLLGAGKLAGRVIGIGSWDDGTVAFHANGGFGAGGVSNEVFWSGATSVAVTPRITVVGEMMGQRLSSLAKLTSAYRLVDAEGGVEAMRWVPVQTGVNTLYAVAGVKWNIGGNWLLNTNVILRLNEAGLHPRMRPGISMDYAFER